MLGYNYWVALLGLNAEGRFMGSVCQRHSRARFIVEGRLTGSIWLDIPQRQCLSQKEDGHYQGVVQKSTLSIQPENTKTSERLQGIQRTCTVMEISNCVSREYVMVCQQQVLHFKEQVVKNMAVDMGDHMRRI